ncbi:hypothetical protein Dda_5655 [Drechslerella dactyloides]|uniref:Uncharacterized protein n=1 Tax=Drechslerella dactyloides TaxID=74499 RepID=A0AAD6IYQ8_DREDA|nr:hypothetical protein Dda_5655 [Drechslerella dactyloides]
MKGGETRKGQPDIPSTTSPATKVKASSGLTGNSLLQQICATVSCFGCHATPRKRHTTIESHFIPPSSHLVSLQRDHPTAELKENPIPGRNPTCEEGNLKEQPQQLAAGSHRGTFAGALVPSLVSLPLGSRISPAHAYRQSGHPDPNGSHRDLPSKGAKGAKEPLFKPFTRHAICEVQYPHRLGFRHRPAAEETTQ